VVRPQIEDGYTRIANELMERVPKFKFNGTQLRIILLIWRYTYGFKRKDHGFALSFLAEATNTSRSQIDRELTALIERKVILVVKEASGVKPRVLRFNKNYEEWESKRVQRPRNGVQEDSVLQNEDSVSAALGTLASSKTSTKKERKKPLKKNTRQQKTYAEDSTYFKMAVYFYEKVSAVAEAEGLSHLTIKADMQKWADEFRKIVEIDEIEDKRLIFDVMNWVTSHHFWKTNVLSAKKLRDKFGELALKMRASQRPNQPERQPDKSISSRDKEAEFQQYLMDGGDPDAFDWS
jgi:phage replication O-like protein O